MNLETNWFAGPFGWRNGLPFPRDAKRICIYGNLNLLARLSLTIWSTAGVVWQLEKRRMCGRWEDEAHTRLFGTRSRELQVVTRA